MESKVVTIEELTRDNPTLCLSALRVFGKCHECKVYKDYHAGRRKKLDCNPHVSPKFLSKLAEKREIQKEIDILKERMRKLNL